MKNVRNIGFDFGFGFIKASDDDGNTATFPTLLKPHRGKKILQDSVQEYIVKINEKTYAVGDFATVGDVVKEWDKEQSLNRENFSIFLGTALWLISEKATSVAEEEYINLSLGLPIDYFADQKEELKKIVDNLSIEVEINSRKKKFIIQNTIISQQGVGAFISLTLDPKGNMRDNIDESLWLHGGGIIDIGYRTVDYIRALKRKGAFVISDDESGSLEDKGIHKSNERATMKINNEYGLTKNVIYYETILKENKGILRNGKENVDIKPYFQEEYNILARDITNLIYSKWEDLDNFGALYFSGGGASLLMPLMKLNVETKLQDNASFANTNGYLAKLALYLEENKEEEIDPKIKIKSQISKKN